MSGLNEAGLAAARKAIIGNPLNDDQLTRIITAYLASTSPGEGGEPVGWQHRIFYDDTNAWSEWRDGRHSTALANPFEERAVYASPDREKIIEALTAIEAMGHTLIPGLPGQKSTRLDAIFPDDFAKAAVALAALSSRGK
jgi:hypothetical protein